MTVFKEIPAETVGVRDFRVYDGEKEAGAGQLTLRGQSVAIGIRAAENEAVKDFLFRALLNVCAGLKNLTVTANESDGYLKRFGFEGGAVRTERIVFDAPCQKELTIDN